MSLPIIIATIMRPEGETGVQSHFQTYCSWLKKSNHMVKLLTPFNLPFFILYPIFGIRNLIHPLSKSASVWWYRYWHEKVLYHVLKTELRSNGPCVVYAQCPLSAEAALRARREMSQKIVLVTHFNVSQADEWAGKGFISYGGRMFNRIRKFEQKILPELDGIVFVSDFMRKELNKRIPSIINVPYEIIPNFFEDTGERKEKDRGPAETKIGELVCVGTLETRKNQIYALEIVSAARELGHPLSLTIIGDGPDFNKLKKYASKLGIGQDVKFLGYIKNASKKLNEFQGCLHTAKMENLPLTLIEAMAHGLPIFASAVGGIPELFKDGVQGRFLPLDNAINAAEIIIHWISSEELMTKASVAAKERFLNNFDIKIVANRLTEFLFRTIS